MVLLVPLVLLVLEGPTAPAIPVSIDAGSTVAFAKISTPPLGKVVSLYTTIFTEVDPSLSAKVNLTFESCEIKGSCKVSLFAGLFTTPVKLKVCPSTVVNVTAVLMFLPLIEIFLPSKNSPASVSGFTIASALIAVIATKVAKTIFVIISSLIFSCLTTLLSLR